MDPIPTWVRRLWDMWDIRVLVLLSFTLQIILCIFGIRRKYISSLWISVLVWSAYLMADWVATVALGKLSDVQSDLEKSNILWAMWAPLLLLHLGGPDGITAYSLEDNRLWLRHLLGLVVQLSVAICVILMSWKNSWFTYLSLPALVAGIIKYGERTWVLKSVSDNNFKDILPLGDIGDKYTTMGHEYTSVLILAHCYLEEFKIYLGGEGRHYEDVRHFTHVNIGDNILWDAVEVSMGLMYDLLYTKATKVYSKGGFILRCISFGCTVTVSVGLIFRIVLLKSREEDQENRHEIDVAITGVLVLGALALEIYAAILICSSNWGMLWLIKQGRGEWVIWLSQRFPWLFNKKKNWSRTMGQFDFLGYCLKVREPADVQKPIRKIIRSVLGRDYEDEWNKYRNKTAYSLHPSEYNAMLDFYKGQRSSRISDLMTESEWTTFRLIFGYLRRPFKGKLFCLHLATEICYHLEIEWNDGGEDLSLWKQNREVCKALSDYMMYLLVMQPSLLRDDGSSRLLEKALHDLKYDLLGHARDKNGACHYLLETYGGLWSMLARDLKGKGKVKRWEILMLMWWGFLRGATATSSNGHFQQLNQGGEFLTFMLFCNFMSNIFTNPERLECGPGVPPWVAIPK